MCMTSVNHLLLVLNTIANFVVYCVFNEGFKKVIFRLLGAKIGSRTPSQQGAATGGGPGAHGPGEWNLSMGGRIEYWVI